MTNHIHLVATPAREDSLHLAVGRTHFIYTQYINRLHGRSGRLWQGRFHSCPMDDAYAVTAMRYVERNPIRVNRCASDPRSGSHNSECSMFSTYKGDLRGG